VVDEGGAAFVPGETSDDRNLLVRTGPAKARKWFLGGGSAPSWQPAAVRITADGELLLALDLAPKPPVASFNQPLLAADCVSISLQLLSAAGAAAATGATDMPAAACYFAVFLDGAPVKNLLLAHVGNTAEAQAFINGVNDCGVSFVEDALPE
jgi:hypothetical protein